MRRCPVDRRVLPALFASTIMTIGCAATEPIPDPPASERALESAARAYERGQVDQAIAFNRNALRIARSQDDAARIATSAHNLAACHLMQNRPAEAIALLGEAEREMARLDQPAGNVRLLRAEALRRTGALDDARTLTDLVLDDPAGTTATRAHAHVIRARIAIDRDDLRNASIEADAARADRTLVAGDPALDARITQVEGAIALREQRPGRAAARFDREATLLASAGQFASMAHALGRAGHAYLRAERPADAADRLYRAARALAAQHRPVAALAHIEPALMAAVDAGDHDLAGDVRRLLEAIQRDAREAKSSVESGAIDQVR